MNDMHTGPKSSLIGRLGSALALNRDEHIQLPFEVAPHVARLLDVAHCEQVSQALDSYLMKWERARATRELWEALPNEPGLYMFVWAPEISFSLADSKTPFKIQYVIYIGQAGWSSDNTIKLRYKGEYSKYLDEYPESLWESWPKETKRKERFKRFFQLRPLQFWYATCRSRSTELGSLERKLIRLLSPPVNVHYKRHKLKPKKKIKAFT